VGREKILQDLRVPDGDIPLPETVPVSNSGTAPGDHRGSESCEIHSRQGKSGCQEKLAEKSW
jgi:hypothetical protein